MKRIEVVAAVIRKGGKIFATQRGYGEFKDWWEFPGGKIEPGETPQLFFVLLISAKRLIFVEISGFPSSIKRSNIASYVDRVPDHHFGTGAWT